MTCRELNDLLDDYVADALTPTERRRFDAHLAGCRPCIAFLDSYRRTVQLARSLCDDPGRPPPPEVPEVLVRAVLSARPGRRVTS